MYAVDDHIAILWLNGFLNLCFQLGTRMLLYGYSFANIEMDNNKRFRNNNLYLFGMSRKFLKHLTVIHSVNS